MDVSYIPIAKARGFTTHLDKEKSIFLSDSKKKQCFDSIIKECQEQELAKAHVPARFLRQEMMTELTSMIEA